MIPAPMGRGAFTEFLTMVTEAIEADTCDSGSITWENENPNWLMVQARVRHLAGAWQVGDEPGPTDTHLPGDAPDPMEVARSRAGDIAHRIEVDMMATLADADASDQEDLVPELVGSAMHQVDILLAEIYGGSHE
jgi:hypothetical protein